jgi:hypothetical protein
MCVDSTYFEQSMPYTFKVFFEGFEVHSSTFENNYMLGFKAKPFGGPNIDPHYIFIFNLTLIYPTLNPNLP